MRRTEDRRSERVTGEKRPKRRGQVKTTCTFVGLYRDGDSVPTRPERLRHRLSFNVKSLRRQRATLRSSVLPSPGRTTMLALCFVLILSASVFSESVRETETWMPMKTTQVAAMGSDDLDLESSGDSLNSSDFGFIDDEDEDEDDYYTDEYSDDLSGSGDEEITVSPGMESRPSDLPDMNNNKIPELESPVRPTINEEDVVRNNNEIPMLRNNAETVEEHPSNVLMSHTSDNSIFERPEVLAAVIASGAVGLLLAVLLISLLIYCLKKKDEGSYDLGKKPIYKKAPTTEIFA
ncbi:syndecan-4 [Mastacembelus armatus]|uniref:Syndecan 4 n=1 Tax=Mastacembelus armatus TaxID=205130 RepID=A0A7N8WTS7_9TELE|nr:syndecan-4-like [Mastacembelus armatus]